MKWNGGGLLFLIVLIQGFLTVPAMANEAKDDRIYYFLYSSQYTYQEMQADLEHLERQYGEFMKTDTLAVTSDGRNLYHVTVGSDQAENHVLVTAAIHGREYITAQLVMRQLEDLLWQYRENTHPEQPAMQVMMANTALHVVPMVNPDGVTLCQLGVDGMQLPQTQEAVNEIYAMDQGAGSNTDYRSWKANARGVDLNRNFDAKWETYNDRTGRPSSLRYKGIGFESEVESSALAGLTRQFPFKRTISYHSQGQVIYWYFEQSGQLLEQNRRFADLIGVETGYYVDSNYGSLDPAGYKDWAISRLGIPSLTVEVGTGVSPVDPNQYEAIWEQNQNVFPVVVKDLYVSEGLSPQIGGTQ